MHLLTLLLFGLLSLVSAGNDHFFQYANVPSPHAYEFGYNRGNHHHFTSRFEKAHGWTFKTKLRWGDKHGWGESYWDYNHGDEKGHKKGHHKGWGGGQQGAFSENVPVENGRRSGRRNYQVPEEKESRRVEVYEPVTYNGEYY